MRENYEKSLRIPFECMGVYFIYVLYARNFFLYGFECLSGMVTNRFCGIILKLESKWRWFFISLWLLFFPNIPYLMTDLFHLTSLRIYQPGGHFLDDSNAWWSYLLLLLPILLMVFVGMVQVFKIISAVKLQMIQKISGIVLSVLSSIAVYIGRFDRVHSIELFIHPMTVLKLLIGNWSVGKFQFVLMFSILQLGIWD